MRDCEVWDLIKVPFPYTDRPTRQRRPALVVAVPSTPTGPALLWVLMVTSAANRFWPGDVAVSDLRAAGLPAPSVVRSAKIATIEAGDAERIGELSLSDRMLVVEALRGSLEQVPTIVKIDVDFDGSIKWNGELVTANQVHERSAALHARKAGKGTMPTDPKAD